MGILKARIGGAWVDVGGLDVVAETAARVAGDNALGTLIANVLVNQTVTATSQTVGTGGTNLTGLSVPVTAQAGQRFVVVGQVIVRQRTSIGLPRLAILTSHPSPATIGLAAASLGVDEYATLMVMSQVNTPGAVTVTYNLQGYTSGGTADYQALATNSIIQVFRV